MKDYLLATRSMMHAPHQTLQRDARTPILNRSNYAALLTPNGRPEKPQIKNLVPMTPLVDEIGAAKADRTFSA